jgi:hypothetical protein
MATLAGEAYDLFETRTRLDSDETYDSLKDDAPQWLQDLVHDAHGSMLPDDWRYATIRAALGFIHDGGLEDVDAAHDASSEFADDNVDVYTGARLEWLGSHLDRPAYCDMATNDFGPTDSGIIDLIGLGQYLESQEVFGIVVRHLDERLEVLGEDAA